jgi:hypothetical protein
MITSNSKFLTEETSKNTVKGNSAVLLYHKDGEH